MSTDTRKEMILAALDAFVRQRSGMDYRNYYQTWTDTAGVAAYRSEARSITRDLHDYRELRRTVELRDSITADDLLQASRDAFSGRLTITEFPAMDSRVKGPLGDSSPYARVEIDYCTGQYFPTEYRKAACAVLASALWYRKREDMPAQTGWRVESWMQLGKGREKSHVFADREAAERHWAELGGREYGSVCDVFPDGLSPGDWLRASFRKEFGRGIAARWFS